MECTIGKCKYHSVERSGPPWHGPYKGVDKGKDQGWEKGNSKGCEKGKYKSDKHSRLWGKGLSKKSTWAKWSAEASSTTAKGRAGHFGTRTSTRPCVNSFKLLLKKENAVILRHRYSNRQQLQQQHPRSRGVAVSLRWHVGPLPLSQKRSSRPKHPRSWRSWPLATSTFLGHTMRPGLG